MLQALLDRPFLRPQAARLARRDFVCVQPGETHLHTPVGRYAQQGVATELAEGAQLTPAEMMVPQQGVDELPSERQHQWTDGILHALVNPLHLPHRVVVFLGVVAAGQNRCILL